MKRSACAALAGLTVLSIDAAAQEVSGAAYIANPLVASSETSILLIDTSGVIVAGTMTNAAGHYTLRAPQAGSFRVRARRVGFAPDSSGPLVLKMDSEVNFNPNLRPLTTSLAVVSVKGTERCVVRPGEGEIASRLWQAAQNTLASAAVSSLGSDVGFVLERFQRQIEPRTNRVVRQTIWQTRAIRSEPYVSISADSLSSKGFALAGSDSSTYFAPDARTLTSDVFAATHCFRPVADRANADRIGLQFEPVAKSGVVDVAGVLWLDRVSSELSTLEYRYTVGSMDGPTGAGGLITYTRLKNGMSIVSDWVIRVPVEKTEMRTAPSTAGNIQDRSWLRISRNSSAVALWEIGGTVKRVVAPSELAVGSGTAGVVRGTLFSEQEHRGLQGISVDLEGASEPRSVTTGEDGSFVFDAIPEGDYTLSVAEPRFDTLNTPVVPVRVHVESGSEQTITIAVPSPNAGRAALCPSDVSPSSVVIHGMVANAGSGAPIPNARVTASWLTDVRVSSANISAAPHELTTYSDSLGRYAFCGVQPTSHLILSAAIGTARSPRLPSITVRSGDTRLYDLRLASPNGPR